MSRARRRLFVQPLESRKLMAGDVGFSGDLPVIGDWDGDGIDQIGITRVLAGQDGSDVVLGQDGNDLLIVNNGDGSDFLEGGEDDIAVADAGGNDILPGGRGNDILLGGDGIHGIEGDDGTAIVREQSVSGNTAGEEGGGLWNSSGAMNVEAVDTVMSEQGGGGIFNEGGTLNLR